MGVLQLLASENFITYNKVIAKKYGVNSAILLGAMCSYQNSFKDEQFFKEQYKISEDTCLTEYEIQQALKILKSNGIIEVNKKGLPAKNYYKVVEYKLLEIFSTSGQNFRPLETENLDDINNNNNTNNKNTRTNNINKERKTSNYDAIVEELIHDENLKNTVYEFIKMRKLIKKPMTDFALKKLLNKLFKMSNDVGTQIKILEQSITACWQDIYPLKDNKPKQDDDDWLQRMEEANKEIMAMDLK